jgi:nitrous oxidase accessory protein NosD
MKTLLVRGTIAGLAGLVGAVVGLAAPAAAKAQPSTVYVSPSGSGSATDHSCRTAAFSSIQAGVEATANRGTVVVCRGTYQQSVTVDHRLTLSGQPGAVIDATGQPYGVGVAASGVTVSGLTVENASDTSNGSPADGIITAGFIGGVPTPADHVTIIHDVTEDNVGAGIDVNSTSNTVAVDNTSSGNGIGINVSDDLGMPASHNKILGNTADGNPGGCGIVLAEHTGAGIFDNLVSGNVANDNGLGTPSAPDASAGSGIILAGAATSGGVYDNTVDGNTFDGNGHGGVALHAHVPGLNFGGNSVVGNRIGVNNLRTDFDDPSTTGVYLGDASPLSITVAGNTIRGDQIGIFTAGAITIRREQQNSFVRVATPVAGTPAYTG